MNTYAGSAFLFGDDGSSEQCDRAIFRGDPGGDSTIDAWFAFDQSAMSDEIVFMTEITRHSFVIMATRLS